jgi:aryl-alcohol dehydrogenase-like predicted oxidoreductase
METRLLPHTELRVSRACLGTMTFGLQTDEAAAARLVDFALERGVNFIDTANVYNAGRSETVVGRLLKNRRRDFILATKVGMTMGEESGESGLSRRAILTSIDNSLRRLQSEYVDIYYLHLPDYGVPIEETLEALDRLVTAGKIRYPGVSNFAAWQVCQILCLSQKHAYSTRIVSQPIYNLLARGIEQEYVPFCKQFEIPMVVYNPLARGVLTGMREQNTNSMLDPSYDNHQAALNRFQHPAYFDAVDELRRVATLAGRTLIDLAFSWLLHHTRSDSIIIGAENVQQLEENLDAFNSGPLPNQAVRGCDVVWRKLRGTTPQYNR